MHFVLGLFCCSCCLSASICPWTSISSKNQNHLSTQKLLKKKKWQGGRWEDMTLRGWERRQEEWIAAPFLPSLITLLFRKKQQPEPRPSFAVCLLWDSKQFWKLPIMPFTRISTCWLAKSLPYLPYNQKFLGAFVFILIRNVSATARNMFGGESRFV